MHTCSSTKWQYVSVQMFCAFNKWPPLYYQLEVRQCRRKPASTSLLQSNSLATTSCPHPCNTQTPTHSVRVTVDMTLTTLCCDWSLCMGSHSRQSPQQCCDWPLHLWSHSGLNTYNNAVTGLFTWNHIVDSIPTTMLWLASSLEIT